MAETKKVILHADDEIGWREYVRAALGDCYQIESGKDFDATIARLAQGGVDLLLLDNLMPGTSPLDDAASVCAFVKKRYPSLPVLVLTSSTIDSPTEIQEMERMIGAPVLFKLDIESREGSLRQRVEQILGK